MSRPTPRQMREHLLREDKATLPDRLDRLQSLVQKFGDDDDQGMLFYGSLSLRLFNEARLAYLHGLDVAAVLLSQATVESTLRSMYRMSGDDNRAEKTSFAELLEIAAKDRLISKTEFRDLDHLRKLRNPYVHAKTPTQASSMFRRIQASSFSKTEEDLTREDAEHAMSIMLAMLRRHPFTIR